MEQRDNQQNKPERRYFDTELRVEKRDDKNMIYGHAAVFNSLSENLGGFREQIDPKAFDGVMDNDVRALFNHNSDKILGRTKSNTLKLKVDEKGLHYEIDPPDTTYSNDLLKSLTRGDITQSSFAFNVDEDEWTEDKDGRVIRTIKKIRRLFDVSPVTFPAYPEADAAKRGYEDFMKTKEPIINPDDERVKEKFKNHKFI